MTNEDIKQQTAKRSCYTRFWKRFFDIIIALVFLPLVLLICIPVAILNLIIHGYPIFYKQARPGKNNKVFYIYKFRSMNNKKDKDGNLLPDSQRITTWGKIIRKLSLDELPQFWNILKGDMSFIGHRPKLVKDVIFYEKDVIEQYSLRPGITGYAAAYGRNRNTWEATFEKDKFYMENASLWLDIKIIFKTIGTVLTNKGESHSNAEEDKLQERKQEYYYADYLLRIGRITKAQYDKGIEIANEIIKNKGTVTYHPELLDQALFEEMYGKQIDDVKESKDVENKKTKTTKPAGTKKSSASKKSSAKTSAKTKVSTKK